MKISKPLLTLALSILVFMVISAGNFALADNEKQAELEKIEVTRKENAQCLRCHGAKGLKTTFEGKTISLYVDEKNFLNSIHESNSCTTCHVGITDYPHENLVYGEKFRIQANKQCQSCHKDINAEYQDSVHGKLTATGKQNALCSDCHGSHNVFKKDDKRSQVYPTNQVNACIKCHEEKWESYNWVIHGKVTAIGSKKPPTCALCHTSHSIFGPSDPRSSVSKANTPETCSQCHLNAPANFAQGIEHYTLTPEGKNAPMYYTYKLFTWLLISVVTFFLIHVLLDIFSRIRNAKK